MNLYKFNLTMTIIGILLMFTSLLLGDEGINHTVFKIGFSLSVVGIIVQLITEKVE